MSDQVQKFGDIAHRLARNPLGIVALFIVLVYGVAALVTAFSGSLSAAERLPLVYFLVIFPVLVLGVFSWLVSRHSNKLFGPGDFRNEENYVRTLSATASLAIATVKGDAQASATDIDAVVTSVQQAAIPTSRLSGTPYWRDHVLWVDDRPDNNINERRAFEAVGLTFRLARSTEEALAVVTQQRFAAIISDMGRPEGAREGYVLLDSLRRQGNQTPFFIYASSNAPEHRAETASHGGQGCTNRPQELFQMVTQAVRASLMH